MTQLVVPGRYQDTAKSSTEIVQDSGSRNDSFIPDLLLLVSNPLVPTPKDILFHFHPVFVFLIS